MTAPRSWPCRTLFLPPRSSSLALVLARVLIEGQRLVWLAACHLGFDARFKGDQGVDDIRADVTAVAHGFETLTCLRLLQEVQDLQYQLARSALVIMGSMCGDQAGQHRARGG